MFSILAAQNCIFEPKQAKYEEIEHSLLECRQPRNISKVEKTSENKQNATKVTGEECFYSNTFNPEDKDPKIKTDDKIKENPNSEPENKTEKID